VSPHDALDAAIQLAGEQRSRLQRGDIDGYIAALPAYGEACALLDDGVPTSRVPQLQHLLALDTEMATLLAQSRDALMAQRAPMGQRRRIARAYFPHSGLPGATIAQA
jgi:hypothetical protein